MPYFDDYWLENGQNWRYYHLNLVIEVLFDSHLAHKRYNLTHYEGSFAWYIRSFLGSFDSYYWVLESFWSGSRVIPLESSGVIRERSIGRAEFDTLMNSGFLVDLSVEVRWLV